MKVKILLRTLALVGALPLASCAAQGNAPMAPLVVPRAETGDWAPGTLRALLDNRIYVHEQRGIPGGVSVRHTSADGTWRGCGISPEGEPVWAASGKWTVGEDARGRATLSARVDGKEEDERVPWLYVVHYDPGTGDVRVRGRGRADKWVTTSRGWAQTKLPQIAVDTCKETDWRGLAVDERQTGTTLAELRRQAPDAVLKGLAKPLPGPQVIRCEHREEQSSRLCASGTGRIVEYKVYGGRCADWGTKTLWGGGPLVREETDDSACRRSSTDERKTTPAAGADAAPPTGGTGRCLGEYEGVATWTLGADGQRVWDTSECRRRAE